jgi:hypothetical protein
MLPVYNRFSQNFHQSPLETTCNRFPENTDIAQSNDTVQVRETEEEVGRVLNIESVSTLASSSASGHSSKEETAQTDSGCQTDAPTQLLLERPLDAPSLAPEVNGQRSQGTNTENSGQAKTPVRVNICITPRRRAGCEQPRRYLGNLPPLELPPYVGGTIDYRC